MQLKEKKSNMERDKRKMECELEKQRQNIGKQVFLQVVQKNKPSKDESLLAPVQSKSVESEVQSTNGLLSPLTLQTSNSSNQPSSLTSRRQWDKSQLKHFDLEQQNHLPNESKKLLSTQNVKTNSSMSTTPTSSASQSPPSNNANKLPSEQQQQQQHHVDLAKTSYSRDEMSKAIELLKEKFVQESLNVAQAAEQIKKTQSSNQSLNQGRLSNSQSAMSNNTAMVKDIEVLNSKLAELQSEINRLTLLQQKQYSQQHTTAQKLLSSASTTTTTSSNVVNNTNNNNAHQMADKQAESNDNQDAANEDEAANGNLPSPFHWFLIDLIIFNLFLLLNLDAFFIAIGNGTAKREKPQLPSSKKQQIFIKSNLILALINHRIELLNNSVV